MTPLEDMGWMLLTVILFTAVIIAVNWLYETVTGWFNIDDLHDLDTDDDEVLS